MLCIIWRIKNINPNLKGQLPKWNDAASTDSPCKREILHDVIQPTTESQQYSGTTITATMEWQQCTVRRVTVELTGVDGSHGTERPALTVPANWTDKSGRPTYGPACELAPSPTLRATTTSTSTTTFTITSHTLIHRRSRSTSVYPLWVSGQVRDPVDTH